MKKEEVICGRRPVEEALQSGRPLKGIYMAAGLKGPVADRLSRMARDAGIPLHRWERKKMDDMTSGSSHQGVAAVASPFAYASLEELLSLAGGRDSFILILDHLQDPQNVGALLRTAEAAGVHGVVIPERRAAGITPGVYKASAGAVEHLPVARVTNLARALKEMKKRGIWVAGAHMDGREIFCQADLKGPLALVLGGEGRGLSPLIRETCDFLVRLPMAGKTGSLNVSVAGGILMYEVLRQRGQW